MNTPHRFLRDASASEEDPWCHDCGHGPEHELHIRDSRVQERYELPVPDFGVRRRLGDDEDVGSITLPRNLWKLGTQIKHPEHGKGVLVRIEVRDDGGRDLIFQYDA